MIEVCNCGEGHRTRLRESTCVYWVPLASVYKGGRKRRPAKGTGAAKEGSPTPTRSRTPPFPSPTRKRGRREEGRRGPAPSHKPIRFGPRGARPYSSLAAPFSTKAHEGPLTPRGVP